MSIVDLLEMPAVSSPRLSPADGSLIYVLGEADWKQNKRISHIWLQPADGGESRQLTRGERGESDPRWSPDGGQIAFVARRGDDEHNQIFLLPVRGGEARRLTDHDTAVSSIEWSPDGGSLYFLASDPKSAEEKKREKAKDDIFAFDEDWKHRRLWRASASDGAAEQITQGDYSVRSYALSRSGSRIALHRAPSPLLDDRWNGEVFVVDSDGGKSRRLTHNSEPESGAELSPDGETALFLSGSNADFEPYYNTNIFVVPVAGGEPRLLLEDMPYEVDAAHWSGDGSSIYFLANTGVRSELFRVDPASEQLTQLTNGDHALSGWSYQPQLDAHVASVSSADNAGDVWELRDGKFRKLTSIYDRYVRDYFIPRQEAISWRGADGRQIEGLLYYPRGYEEGTRYPLAVQTHGGPQSSDKFGFGRWSSYVQVLTDRGWMVLKPNYRGSTGYGDEFLRNMVGHYFDQAHLDVMTGVDHLIEQGLADGERMVKMGWSGGGHMTNKIITHTDRFKAASSGAGASNWVSMYGQTDIRIHRGNWFGGSPWTKDAPIHKYWETSAISQVWKVKTPTLVLVGQNDERVPAPQSIELYRALRANGVDTHLYMAPREPHGWRELRHELFKVNVELEWFEKHALGREYEWETAPSDETEADEDDVGPGQAAESQDQRTLRRAGELLRDEAVWNREDSRRCPDAAPKLSLYCALRQATKEVIGVSYHRTMAMEEIRSVIQEKAGDKRYPHRLMGYNNDPSTSFADIRDVISTAATSLARRTQAIEAREFVQVTRLEDEAATSANVDAGDLDSDGDLDLVLAKGRHWPLHNRILLNDGSGGFSSAENLEENADRTYTTALADLDGDGDLDITVSNDRPDANRVYLNSGDGRFSPAGVFGNADWATRNMALADLNRDGRPDAILANRGSMRRGMPRPSAVCLNDGSGAFPQCQELPTESATTIVAADFDADGAADLAVPHRDGGRSLVFWGDGSGSFAQHTVFGLLQSNARAAAAGDMDGDGLPELVIGDEQRGVFVVRNRGRRQLPEALLVSGPGRAPYSIALADLNRDGSLDIVVGYRQAEGSIFFNDGGGALYRETAWNDGAGAVYGLALGDFDQDGWIDIAGARSNAANAVWFNKSPN